MPNQPATEKVGWRIPPDRIARLKAIAARDGRTVTAHVIEAIDAHLARHEPENQ